MGALVQRSVVVLTLIWFQNHSAYSFYFVCSAHTRTLYLR